MAVEFRLFEELSVAIEFFLAGSRCGDVSMFCRDGQTTIALAKARSLDYRNWHF
jgi:hypothetical protein